MAAYAVPALCGRGEDAGDVIILRAAGGREVGREVLPGPAAVPGELDLAVVRARSR
ncbi:MAG: hypothetical protein M0C28_46445 [Candidatus Moduliflexus flocculans]|nr:hypothetical protein [Candidatus Moduliflexus flocculans]